MTTTVRIDDYAVAAKFVLERGKEPFHGRSALVNRMSNFRHFLFPQGKAEALGAGSREFAKADEGGQSPLFCGADPQTPQHGLFTVFSLRVRLSPREIQAAAEIELAQDFFHQPKDERGAARPFQGAFRLHHQLVVNRADNRFEDLPDVLRE